MRNSIKVLSVVLAVLLLVPFCVNVSADTQSADIEILSALGILNEDDALGNGEAVSRSYFTKYAVKLTGLTDAMMASQDYENPFTDINDDPNKNAVKAAYNLGLISGTSQNTFSPKSNITVAQAVKILVSALGYGGYAAYEGGYPSGYLIMADRIKLLKGISVNNDEVLTWETFAALLYNAYNTDVLKGVGVVEDGNKSEAILSSKEGETPLALFYDIYRKEGILDSNEFTSLTGLSEVPEGAVSVAGETMKLGSTSAYDLIGYYVECFYKLDEIGNKTLLYIKPVNDRNKVYNVTREQIVSGDVSTTRFTFFEDGAKSSTKLSISNIAVMIYNGVQVEMSAARMVPSNGDVTLIDNNRDNVFDVVSVMNYETYFVTGIAVDTFTVHGKNGSAVDIDPLSDDYLTVMEDEFGEVTFDEIKMNNVISCAAYPSENRYIKYVKYSAKSVVGTVEQIDVSGGYVTINGTEYKYDSGAGLAVGTSGTFYQDYFGTIVAVNVTKSFVYGYLNSLHKGAGLNSKVTVQILSENENWIETSLADRLRIDGEDGKTPAEFYAMHSGDYRQLIRYNVNTDGEVIEIDFAETETADTDPDNFRLSKTVSSDNYRKSPLSFGGSQCIWSDTIIFAVPSNADYKYDKERFDVFTVPELISGGAYNNIRAYDVDEFGIAPVIMVDAGDQVITNSMVFIVEDVVTTLNAKGDTVPGIKAYFDGSSYLTICARDANVITEAGGISRGDIIQCTISEENEIVKISKRYDFSEDYGSKFLESKVYATATFTAGIVKKIDYERLRFKYNYGGSSDVTYCLDGVTYVHIYDVDTGKITIADISQLREDDYIFTRVNSMYAKEIVVFR